MKKSLGVANHLLFFPGFPFQTPFLPAIAAGLALTCWIPMEISFASPAMLLAALDSEAALPRIASARSVFSLALATMLLMIGSLFMASSASLLLSSACRLNSERNACGMKLHYLREVPRGRGKEGFQDVTPEALQDLFHLIEGGIASAHGLQGCAPGEVGSGQQLHQHL